MKDLSFLLPLSASFHLTIPTSSYQHHRLSPAENFSNVLLSFYSTFHRKWENTRLYSLTVGLFFKGCWNLDRTLKDLILFKLSVKPPEVELRPSSGLINLQKHCLSSGYSIMDVRKTKNSTIFPNKNLTPLVEGKQVDYQRSLSQGRSRRLLAVSYFSLEWLLLLIGLTASLLILPLILPPLPPPPFMLLLLPICMLAVLMILAFMPSNVREVSQTYA